MSEVHPSDTAAQSAGEPDDKEVEEKTVLKDAGVELCLDLLQPSANQQAPVELLAEVYTTVLPCQAHHQFHCVGILLS